MVHSDATAAVGIARREGLDKVRHLDVTDLWFQNKVNELIGLRKRLGADIGRHVTKYVERSIVETTLATINLAGAVSQMERSLCQSASILRATPSAWSTLYAQTMFPSFW